MPAHSSDLGQRGPDERGKLRPRGAKGPRDPVAGGGREPRSGDSPWCTHGTRCWEAAAFLNLGLQPGGGNPALGSVAGKATAPHAHGMGSSRVLRLGFLHVMFQMMPAHVFLPAQILSPDSVRASCRTKWILSLFEKRLREAALACTESGPIRPPPPTSNAPGTLSSRHSRWSSEMVLPAPPPGPRRRDEQVNDAGRGQLRLWPCALHRDAWVLPGVLPEVSGKNLFL